MNRIIYKRAAALAAAAAVLFSVTSCGMPEAEPSPSESFVGVTAKPAAAVASARTADHLFTVRYHDAHTLNPIIGSDPDNMALVPLQYESLFVLNSKFVPEPLLCESYSVSADGSAYTFKLKPNILMSDGSTLTSADVKYTLSEAKQTGRFTGRLKNIDSIATPDSLTVKITLKYADFMFTQLMDVPIIKINSVDQNHPAGSGPFVFMPSSPPPP